MKEICDGKTCKDLTCTEAVLCMMDGYETFDRDNDLIPCEDKCKTADVVKEGLVYWHDYFKRQLLFYDSKQDG